VQPEAILERKMKQKVNEYTVKISMYTDGPGFTDMVIQVYRYEFMRVLLLHKLLKWIFSWKVKRISRRNRVPCLACLGPALPAYRLACFLLLPLWLP
jgi:hypothetical protein